MSEPDRVWLVLEASKQLWWGPNSGGYTSNVLRAGLYTEAEAKAIERFSDRYGRSDKARHISTERAVILEMAEGVARLQVALALADGVQQAPDEARTLATTLLSGIAVERTRDAWTPPEGTA